MVNINNHGAQYVLSRVVDKRDCESILDFRKTCEIYYRASGVIGESVGCKDLLRGRLMRDKLGLHQDKRHIAMIWSRALRIKNHRMSTFENKAKSLESIANA